MQKSTPLNNCDIYGQILIACMSKDEALERFQAEEKQFSCEVCGKSFNLLANLKRHERIHTGEKPYVCKICRHAFIQLCALQDHKRIHTGEKPYVCNICKKAFNRKGSVKVHEKIHSKGKIHVCKICGIAFGRLQQLGNHERFHSGENPFVCEICKQAFSNRSYLARHQKKHSEQEQSSIISDQSSSEVDCLEHCEDIVIKDKSVKLNSSAMLSYRPPPFNVKPFGCGFCDEMFVDETNFLVHCSIHLGDSNLTEYSDFYSHFNEIVFNERLNERNCHHYLSKHNLFDPHTAVIKKEQSEIVWT